MSAVELTPKQTAHLGGLGVELLDEAAQIIAIAREPGLEVSIRRDSTASTISTSTGLAPTSWAASNARTRCWPIWKRGLQLGGEQGRGGVGQHVGLAPLPPGAKPSLPIDIVALPVAQAAELEHRGAVSDLLHLGPAQVVLQLGMADQHDRELPPPSATSSVRRLRRSVSWGGGHERRR